MWNTIPLARVVRVLLGVLSLCATAVGAAIPAHAAPLPGGVSYVAIGDSFSAGPEYDEGCVRLPYTWPVKLAANLEFGADWYDASCSGLVLHGPDAPLVGEQLDEVIAAGALGARTQLVTLQVGGNERYGGANRSAAWSVMQCLADFVHGCNEPHSPEFVRSEAITAWEYLERFTAGDSGDVVAIIRHHAPNAHIALVGYPEVLPSAAAPRMCMPVLSADLPVAQPRAGYAYDVLDRVEAIQSETTSRLGIEFWSLRAATTGHDICRPAGERWITRIGDAPLPFHPNEQGYAAQANAIAEIWVNRAALSVGGVG